MPHTVVKACAMPKDMEERAIQVAIDAVEESTTEQEIAAYVKAEFEREYGHVWHCFVGRNFGCFVTHEKDRFIYLYIGQIGVCLFGTT